MGWKLESGGHDVRSEKRSTLAGWQMGSSIPPSQIINGCQWPTKWAVVSRAGLVRASTRVATSPRAPRVWLSPGPGLAVNIMGPRARVANSGTDTSGAMTRVTPTTLGLTCEVHLYRPLKWFRHQREGRHGKCTHQSP